MTFDVLPGKSFPIGATIRDGGVNFCLFSRDCTAIELLLFDRPNDPQPSQVLPLDPKQNKTAHYWHAFVPGIGAGQVYAYRGHGLFAPEQGLRCDGNKVLLDPYTKAIANWENYSRQAASQPGDNCAQALRGVVIDSSAYDWEGDAPPKTRYNRTIIYELHVSGFTQHPNSSVSPEKRGTYAGLIEKIPYLQQLGITAVELLPAHQFDKEDARPGLKNYWGYSPIAFFAPHVGYSSRTDPLSPVNEFRDMVKALHRAGIEVILDVVFNHTAEGDEQGPTLSFRGLSNWDYYILGENRAIYRNYSGCGNTFKADSVAGNNLVLDCLRYWVSEMHIDGFRFDLAAVLARGATGQLLTRPPALLMIDADPVLAGTKLIAEAWDAEGLYLVGAFVGERFAEWNGPYRDDVRRFVKSDVGVVKALANRILASPDIYSQPNREPNRSINFITCHDGFTLNDLVSYNDKHNHANGEDNRDGTNANYSWNCGIEGETNDVAVNKLRLRQIKNFLTILFVSQGTPMLLMGDEVRRSQQGNNNAYCQDNELSWFDWSAIDKHTEVLRFTQKLISFTQSLKIFHQDQILAVSYGSHQPHIIWHGKQLGQPDWSYESHSLAFTLRHPKFHEHLYVILNAYWESVAFELPLLESGYKWYRIVDTALPNPEDFCDLQTALPLEKETYQAHGRSTVVLMAHH
ncbi:glycogen debranching protein GlgX [Scytonema sp. UIC 10036]|uniref:glycogen debranching protein GlgX n=1 Tax=Scytonema sp. UIC 10036 TaxID=2304196 RepID=UPI0012DAE87F|nr:glycogen debranching protein GlgX [Scytonema sp. UIC 10036]MUG94834.1 glycogen debranching protein GlgX [Scytonema sp. UIC 10036]